MTVDINGISDNNEVSTAGTSRTKETLLADSESTSPTETNATSPKKKRKYRKRKKTSKSNTKQTQRGHNTANDTGFSSSDDNITLQEIKEQNDQKHKKDNLSSDMESVYESGDSYKPCKEDYHSSDSNLSVQASDISVETEILTKSATKKRKKKKS